MHSLPYHFKQHKKHKPEKMKLFNYPGWSGGKEKRKNDISLSILLWVVLTFEACYYPTYFKILVNMNGKRKKNCKQTETNEPNHMPSEYHNYTGRRKKKEPI